MTKPGNDFPAPEPTEERLRLLSAVVEQSAEGVAAVDLGGHIQFVNRAFAAMHGYVPKELTGRHLSIFHTPDQLPTVDAANRAIQEGGEFRGEIWHARRDGTVFPAMMHNTLLRSETGQPVGIIGTMTDISELKNTQAALEQSRVDLERKVAERTAELAAANARQERDIIVLRQTQEALRTSERQYRTLIEELPYGLAIIQGAAPHLALANPAMATITGYTIDELMSLSGEAVGTLAHPDDRAAFLQRYRDRLNGRSFPPPRYELRALHKDGTVRWLDISSTRVEYGGTPAVRAVFVDVTARKLAEQELRRSEVKYRTLVERIPAMIYTSEVDEFSSTTYVGPQVERFLGYSAEEYVADPQCWAKILHPDDRAHVLAELASCQKTGRPFVSEYRVMARDGRVVWLHDEGALVHDEGEALCLQGIMLDITEHKRADAALRAAKDYAEKLVETVNAIFVALDKQGRVTAANKAAETITGYSKAELLGCMWFEKIVPRDRYGYVWEEFGELLDGGLPRRFENPIHTKSGEERYIVWQNSEVSEDGRITGTISFGLDITERKRAEAALAAAKEFQDRIINAVADPLFVKDRQHRMVLVNDAECALTGHARPAVLGHTDYDFFPTEQVDVFWAKDEAVFETGQENVNEEQITDAQGNVRTIVTKKTRYTDAAGNKFIVGVIRDITDRKRAEDAVRESEVRYRTLVENIADGVALVTENRMEYVSPAFCRIFGRTAEQLQGQPPEAVVAPEHRARAAERVRGLLDGGTPGVFLYEIARPDGSRAHIEASSNTILWAGRPTLLSVVRDVTEREQIRQERVKLAELLHDAQTMQAVGQVALGLTHNFRNLLLVAREGVREIRKALPASGKTARTARTIEQVVAEAHSTIQSLMMFSRHLPVQRAPLKLCETVRESAGVLRHLLPPAIELRVDAPGDPPCWVNADAAQLRQVLLNLTLNARDALPAGGKLEISVAPAWDDSPGPGASARHQPRTARLTVRDTGAGMTPDTLAHIFKPFFTTKPPGQGTGLGLTTVQSIVRDHGGKIAVQSAVNEGTAITITLPTLTEEDLRIMLPQEAPVPGGRAQALLLYIPEEYTRRMIVSALRLWDYHVVAPATEQDACDACLDPLQRFAALIMSTDRPGRVGLSCLRKLRAAGSRAPVILTASGADAEVQAAVDHDCVLFSGPFQIAELGMALGRLLADTRPNGE